MGKLILHEILHNAATEVDERTGSFDNNSYNNDMLSTIILGCSNI